MKLKNSALFRTKNFINGQWLSADNNKTFDVLNPFNQQKIADVPLSGEVETQQMGTNAIQETRAGVQHALQKKKWSKKDSGPKITPRSVWKSCRRKPP